MGGNRTEVFSARCWCGAIHAELETARAAAELPLRSCTCAFCTKHRTRNTSDPEGRVRIRLRNPGRLSAFDFTKARGGRLICAFCGVYVAMAKKIGGDWYASLNVNAFDRVAEFVQPAQPVDYGGESPAQTRARRLAKWTPATIDFGAAGAGRRG